MTTTIYFVRHGEVHNPENIWYGRLPRYRLSKKGKEQISQTAEFFKNQNIDYIYASPLLRARQTARIIADTLHLPIHFSKKLLETHSSMQGKSFDYLDTIDFDVYASSTNSLEAETFDDLANRIKLFIKQIIRKHPGKKIIAVSHGDPIMAVNLIAKQIPVNHATLHLANEIYVTHGEVLEIVHSNEKDIKTSRLFQPK